MKSRPCGWVFRVSRASRAVRERRLPCLCGLARLVGFITHATCPRVASLVLSLVRTPRPSTRTSRSRSAPRSERRPPRRRAWCRVCTAWCHSPSAAVARSAAAARAAWSDCSSAPLCTSVACVGLPCSGSPVPVPPRLSRLRLLPRRSALCPSAPSPSPRSAPSCSNCHPGAARLSATRLALRPHPTPRRFRCR